MNSKLAIVVVFVIIISVGVGAYYVTLLSTPTSRVPKSLEIISHTSYTDEVKDITFFVVAGVIQNNLTTNVDSVNITATFFDVANNTIGTEVSQSELNIIKSGQKSPFEVSLVLGSSTDIPYRYELSASCFETDEEPVAGLEIVNEVESFDEDGYHRIVGQVQNNGKRKAFSVKVICTYHNLDGDVIAISHAYVSQSVIEGGDKAVFELSSKPHEINPASYELFIVAQRYEPLLITNYVLLAILVVVFVLFIVYMKRRGW